MIKKILFIFILLISLSLMPVLVWAQNNDPFKQAQNLSARLDLPVASKIANTTPTNIIVNSIRYFLTFVGLILVVSIMYAGWQWMSSGGEAEKIDKAKGRLKYSILGLAIIVSGYAIVIFVNNTMTVTPRRDVITNCNSNQDCINKFGPHWYCGRNTKNCLYDYSH